MSRADVTPPCYPVKLPATGAGEEVPAVAVTDVTPAPAVESEPRLVRIRPWPDPVVDQLGVAPTDDYVETWWLGLLGPTSTWLLRRLVKMLAARPEATIDLDVLAVDLGVKAALLERSLARLVTLGLARRADPYVEVRRRIPPIPLSHASKLSPERRVAHERALAGGEPLLPQVAPEGSVLEAGPNRWLVASRSTPGAWWAVERCLEDNAWRVTCPCPWGRSQKRVAWPDRIACRHLKLVVAHQNAQARRPVSPPHVEALVD